MNPDEITEAAKLGAVSESVRLLEELTKMTTKEITLEESVELADKVRISKHSLKGVEYVPGRRSAGGSPMVMMSLADYEKELGRMERKGRKGLFEEIYTQLMPSEGSLLTLVRSGGRLQIAVTPGAELDGSSVIYDPMVSGSGMDLPMLKKGGKKPSRVAEVETPVEYVLNGTAVGSVVDKKPETAVGWYQDKSGNLSYFNGDSWSRDKKTPKVIISELEFLGE